MPTLAKLLQHLNLYVPVELGDLYKRPVIQDENQETDEAKSVGMIQDIENQETDEAKSVAMIQDIENQETDETKSVAMHRRSWFHPVIQRIYVGFWKVAMQYVPHIQQLKEDKVTHIKVLVLLKCICEEVGKIDEISVIREHYLEAITLAVEHDNPEAVEEIIRFFPQAISSRNNDYSLIQLAIINRCERVYKFLVHNVTTDMHVHKVRHDEYGNNLLHLAGHLAPIHKLNLVSGAALQMQRELQWFEVNKLFLHY
ncbi:hypothetical protein L2E82_49929 [Cichorium intybus]|nr:hypothetical protein L2E82_49929 [Cichorium intybus]